jgi:hypothetical protein
MWTVRGSSFIETSISLVFQPVSSVLIIPFSLLHFALFLCTYRAVEFEMRAPYIQVLICLQWCCASPASGALSPEHLGNEEKGALGAALGFEGSVLVECKHYSKEELVHCIRLPVDSVGLSFSYPWLSL